MRCTVQLGIFLVWNLSFVFTNMLNAHVNSNQRNNEPADLHLERMRILVVTGAKDIIVAGATLAMVGAVYGGVFNSCFGWSNGISGLVRDDLRVDLSMDLTLKENSKIIYPALVAVAVFLQFVLFALSWYQSRRWASDTVRRIRAYARWSHRR